jgi:hypothetical protein
MSSRVRVVALLFLLPLAACRGRTEEPPPEARQAALDLGTGSLDGTITWNGAAVPGEWLAGSWVTDSSELIYENPDDAGHYAAPAVPSGYTSLSFYLIGFPDPVATQDVEVPVAGSTTADFDLTATAGRLTFTVTSGGAATRGWVDFGGVTAATNEDGTFSRLVPAGDYAPRIYASPPGIWGAPIPITITAGQTLELGTIALTSGSVAGSVVWNGAAVSSPRPDRYSVVIEPYRTSLDQQGQFSFGSLAAGSYTAQLMYGACSSNTVDRPISIASGATTPLVFDLTSTFGRVEGTVTYNGAPATVSDVNIMADECIWMPLDGDGRFSEVVPPGTYTMRFQRQAGIGHGGDSQTDTRTVTVSAGQTVDMGTIALASGSVTATATWGGAPLTQGGVYLGDPPTGQFWGQPGQTLGGLKPGPFALGLYSSFCQGAGPLAQTTVNVLAGSNTPVSFDVTSALGAVQGTVVQGGVPVGDASVTFVPRAAPSCGTSTSLNGGWGQLLVPGVYDAYVYGDTFKGSFSFTVVAGQTTDLGTITLASAGTASGQVTWNGAPVDGSDGEACVWIHSGETGYCPVPDASGHYSSPLPPGTYAAGFAGSDCVNSAESLLANVVVTESAATTANLELGSVLGLFKGTITLNGVPAAEGELDIVGEGAQGCERDVNLDQDGRFSMLLDPGQYRAYVYFESFNGSFTFTVKAGQVTDLDGVETPPGSGVAVDVNGGLATVGGVSIQFANVTSGGQTTVVATGIGPAPPTGYRVLGFAGQSHYWNLDTSATYSGPIHVCFHYDQAWVTAQESQLRLVHDAGSGFANITLSLDTTANVVCGTTMSLSPFAIVEPIGAPNSAPSVQVPADQLVEASGPAGASVGYTATAADAEDGGLASTCSPPTGATFPLGDTLVSCTATDSAGLSATATFHVRVRDTQPPVLTNVPLAVNAYAGAAVAFPTPAAADAVDGVVPVACTPASGAALPVGKTVVTCTATDASGNAASATFPVTVTYQAPSGGAFFLQPINPDGSSIFKAGSTVPVKFQLQGASAGITNLAARIFVARVSAGVTGTYVETTSNAAPDGGNLFRYDASARQYIYNLSTKGLATGTWSIRVDLGDSVEHSVRVSLK